MDQNGTFIDVNQQAEKLTGYHRLELFRYKFSDVNILSISDINIMEKCLAEVSQKNVAGPYELMLTKKDGSKVPIEVRSFQVTIQNLPAVLSIARDTSAC